MSEIVLETKGLTKDYGENRGVFDIDLSVKRGEVFGYVGTNGSGKTTTIRSLMGFIKADKGAAEILSMDSWAQSAEIMQRVSYVPGEIAFPALSTGTEFLKLQAEYLGVKDFSYMNHVIELLQLDTSANLRRMSKGMKQKTALVAALMGEKEILVLDEPTTGLDPLMRDAFLELIREEKAKGHTVFMSSHIFEELEEVCDRVAMIRDGRIADTPELYDLRHPKEKHVAVEFESESAAQRFLNENGFAAAAGAGKICSIAVPTEDINQLFAAVSRYDYTAFHEEHLTLEQHFMKIYSKGAEKNDR